MRVVPSVSKHSVRRLSPIKKTVGVPVRGAENQRVEFKIRKKKGFKELARKVLVNLSLRYLGIDWVKLSPDSKGHKFIRVNFRLLEQTEEGSRSLYKGLLLMCLLFGKVKRHFHDSETSQLMSIQ